MGSVLNSLIYLLEDCINRLQVKDFEIYSGGKFGERENEKKKKRNEKTHSINRPNETKIENEKHLPQAIQENELQQRSGAWDRLPARERSKKEGYLRSEASVTRGFMRMALQALDVLGRLAGEPAIAASFATPLLSGKVAFAVVAFMNSVAGDRGRSLASIEQPQRFRYDPVRLQKSMVTIALRLRRARRGARRGGGGDGGSSDAGAALVRPWPRSPTSSPSRCGGPRWRPGRPTTARGRGSRR